MLRLGFRSFHVQQRQIVDGSRPGKFHVIECGIVMRPGRKLRERHYEKDDMPQSRGNQCPARKPALNPAIFEESFDRKSLGHRRFAEDHFQAAANPLMKTSPGNIQLRRTAGGQTDPGARHGSGLSGTGEGVKAVQRHIPFDCACDALVAFNGSTPLRISLRIPSEIRSSA